MLFVKYIRMLKLLPSTVMTHGTAILFTFPIKSKEHRLTLTVAESIEDTLLKKQKKTKVILLPLADKPVKIKLGHTVVFFMGIGPFPFLRHIAVIKFKMRIYLVEKSMRSMM